MFNAERNTTSDLLSDNSAYHASIDPMLSTVGHSSSHGPVRRTSTPHGQDPWSTMLATIRQLSSPPDPMGNTRALSGVIQSGGGSFRPRNSGEGDVRTFTVRVVEALSNSLFSLCWHDPTLCNYQEQVWSPSRARASGRCALSGKQISRGDPVYRPRVRGAAMPLNGDAMILASELVKQHTSA
jgi:hypothetical protein